MVKNKISILMVEDDESTRKSLTLVLNKKGYETKAAETGSKALKKAKKKLFNLILLDLNLPDVNGLELIEPLKKIDPDIIIIIMTGHASMQNAVRALNQGASGYVTKPLDLDDVLAKIIECLEKQRLNVENKRLLKEVQKELDERKQVEKSLRRSEKRYETFYTNTPAMFHTIDSNNKLVDVNDRWLKVLGYERSEVIGHNPGDFMTEESWHYAKTVAIPEVMKTGYIHNVEYQFVKKNGEILDILLSGLVEQDKEGNFVWNLAVLTDITERKNLEKQLQEAQRLEAVGQLAGGVAHDFNNHLAAILGYTELCLMSVEKDSQLAEDLRAIMNRTKKGANLVGQLLAFSRKQVISIKSIDLNQIVEETLSFIKPLLGEDIMLIEELDRGVPEIKADPTAVDQIITNLCINARDAMQNGGKITIGTKLVSIDEEYSNSHVEALVGKYVVLSVTDKGTGIEEEVLSRIYEPFFTTKEVSKGSGMGLSMVYGLMKQHGGFVECNSELGMGTEFKIYFAVTGSAIKRVESELSDESTVLGGNETILLVEDDVDVLRITKRGLERRGYTVLTAENGHDALNIYEKNRNDIDLVITDVVLPLMSGIDFYESVQKMDPDVRFLFISGYADGILKQKFNIEKDIEILKKPFENQHIAVKIREVLDT